MTFDFVDSHTIGVTFCASGGIDDITIITGSRLVGADVSCSVTQTPASALPYEQ